MIKINLLNIYNINLLIININDNDNLDYKYYIYNNFNKKFI
jgi:hypothetical protein